MNKILKQLIKSYDNSSIPFTDIHASDYLNRDTEECTYCKQPTEHLRGTSKLLKEDK